MVGRNEIRSLLHHLHDLRPIRSLPNVCLGRQRLDGGLFTPHQQQRDCQQPFHFPDSFAAVAASRLNVPVSYGLKGSFSLIWYSNTFNGFVPSTSDIR